MIAVLYCLSDKVISLPLSDIMGTCVRSAKLTEKGFSGVEAALAHFCGKWLILAEIIIRVTEPYLRIAQPGLC